MKVVIVGGVAGGATAAARLRRLDETAEIIIIERTHYVSYANCGLPYYIGGTITDRDKLTLQTPESFHSHFNIDVRIDQEVTHIDREHKQVVIRKLPTNTTQSASSNQENQTDQANLANTVTKASPNTESNTYVESYDKLILSPGAHPVLPPLPGVNASRLFTLRTVEDTFAIADFIETHQVHRATIVGGGFIGLEMAENLVNRGLAVTVLQRPNHLMPTLDPDMASLLHNRFREAGVALMFNADVTGFEESQTEIRTHVQTKTGHTASSPAISTIESDLVILAIGVAPENTLAKEANLELGLKGAIKVDAHLRTSDPDIYAIGDAIETTHVITHQPAHIALAGLAKKQGRIVADHICGIYRTFSGSQGSSIMKAFDLTVATTGLNTKAATAAGLTFDAVILSPASHATYYPGSHPMTMKVLFESLTGRIIGAQIIGKEGTDKRIDVLAVAIKAGMSAYDLTELDLAYAPPYASAKDPINMAGYMIENIREGMVTQISWDEAFKRISSDPQAMILDTRTPNEYAQNHLDGVTHIPLDEMRERLDELPQDKTILVHCASGLRSYLACRILSQKGFACANIAGGFTFYQALQRDRNASQTTCMPDPKTNVASIAENTDDTPTTSDEGIGDCGPQA